jgi:hypothetical protein
MITKCVRVVAYFYFSIKINKLYFDGSSNFTKSGTRNDFRVFGFLGFYTENNNVADRAIKWT